MQEGVQERRRGREGEVECLRNGGEWGMKRGRGGGGGGGQRDPEGGERWGTVERKGRGAKKRQMRNM